MNKTRRTELEKVIARIEAEKEEIRRILDAEQEAFDSRPDDQQAGKLADRNDDIKDVLIDAINCLDDTISRIQEAMN